jgi:hypothetical protein
MLVAALIGARGVYWLVVLMYVCCGLLQLINDRRGGLLQLNNYVVVDYEGG